jgi:curved DNA-binding protein CbpA
LHSRFVGPGETKHSRTDSRFASMVKSTVLYDLMRVEPTATTAEIRKAYLKLSAKVHPDKSDAPDAQECFMALKKAYDILKDDAKRERYDRTGASDQESQSFQDAYERYRGVPLDTADIDTFLFKYRGSEQEEQDLLAFLKKSAGDVSTVLGHIMGSCDADIPRFVAFYEEALKKSAYKKYRKAFDPSAIMSVGELEAADGQDLTGEDDSDGDDDDDGDDDLADMIDDGEEDEYEEAPAPPPAAKPAPSACPPGVDPALFAMLQSKNDARAAAFEEKAARWVANGKAEAAAGKAKRDAKQKAAASGHSVGGSSGGIGKSKGKASAGAKTRKD